MSAGPSPLSPEDRLRARRAVAADFHWPAGALEACLAIEADFPGWTAYWSAGRLGVLAGFRAARVSAPVREVWAEGPSVLRELVAAIEAEFPACP